MSQKTTDVKVTAWIHGSTNNNVGAWAALLNSSTGRELTIKGGEFDTTSARMELTAAVQTLEKLDYPCTVEIMSDNNNIVRGGNEWIYTWVKQEWRNSRGKVKKNIDLWQRLLAQLNKHSVTFTKVRTNDGIPQSEYIDKIAWETRRDLVIDMLNAEDDVYLFMGSRDATEKMVEDAKILVRRVYDMRRNEFEANPWVIVDDANVGIAKAVVEAANALRMNNIVVIGIGDKPENGGSESGYYLQAGKNFTERNQQMALLAKRGYFIHDGLSANTSYTYNYMRFELEKPTRIWNDYLIHA